jgi:hypothetical protein
MDEQDDGALRVRAELDRLTAAGPPLGFSGADVIAAGRRRQRRAVLGIAAGTAVVVGVAAAILVPTVALGGRSSDPGQLDPVSVAGPGSATPTTAGSRSTPKIPGLSDQQAQAIAVGCVKSFAGPSGDLGGLMTPTVPPPSPGVSGPLSPDRIHTYNVVKDAAGTMALVYGPTVALSCDVGGPAGQFNAGGGFLIGRLEWLPGPVSIDFSGGNSGGRPLGKYPTERGSYVVAGRVASNVTRVSVSHGPASLTVRPVNGTYLARFVYSVDWPNPDLPVRVRGYDAAGGLVAEAPGVGTCFVTPDGKRSMPEWSGHKDRCVRAVPWP